MVDADGGVEGLSVCNGWGWHGSWLLSHGIGMLLKVSIVGADQERTFGV
jgi:hypothetical protein